MKEQAIYGRVFENLADVRAAVAEREHTRPPMVRCYAVFNVAQADGLQLERKGDDREHELAPSG